jgi:hypothetical protein
MWRNFINERLLLVSLKFVLKQGNVLNQESLSRDSIVISVVKT